jgi:hypothetical protein
MGFTLGDGIVVASIAAVALTYLYLSFVQRRRERDILLQERRMAIERRIPIRELRNRPKASKPADTKAPLLHAIVWAMLTGGAILALAIAGTRLTFAVLLPAIAAILSALASLACEAGTVASTHDRAKQNPYEWV